MTTRRTEPTHEADQRKRDAAPFAAESPSADRMQGSNGPLHHPDPDDNPAGGDQDIDTAGTDADDQSPTKAMGTGIARPGSRG